MSLTQKALEALASFGADRVDPPISIEAKVPLELSGEAVRIRICTFFDQAGLEWALRPDLTLAVAQDEVTARRGGPNRGNPAVLLRSDFSFASARQ